MQHWTLFRKQSLAVTCCMHCKLVQKQNAQGMENIPSSHEQNKKQKPQMLSRAGQKPLQDFFFFPCKTAQCCCTVFTHSKSLLVGVHCFMGGIFTDVLARHCGIVLLASPKPTEWQPLLIPAPPPSFRVLVTFLGVRACAGLSLPLHVPCSGLCGRG